MTVVFADVVGFTALAEHRDPEQVKRLVDVVFERLGAIVEQYGGEVDKLLGDGLLALFGAPIAHEDDAERGVRAALEMLDVVRTAWPGERLELRIGINTGEVLAGRLAGGEYTAMGDVVNTASRLQTLAPSGGVLVGDATRALCSDTIRFEPVEPQRLRGRNQVEATWLATGVESASDRRRRRSHDVDFAGRHEELAILEAVQLMVRRGSPAIVSITGEAGIGKTRLVGEVLDRLERTTPVHVYEGQCPPYGESNPYAPIATALAERLGVRRDQSTESVRARLERVLRTDGGVDERDLARKVDAALHLLGHPSGLDGLDPVTARDLVIGSVVSFVRNRAADRPVVLWIDDLQWAASVIIEMLGVLARSVDGLPVLVVTAARPTDEPEWPQIADRVTTAHVPLGPLSFADASLLAEHAVRGPISDGQGAVLYERSGGNPLFLVELARLTDPDIGVPADLDELPGSLRALVASRLDQLSPDQRAVIDNAAVLGSDGSIGGLRAFADAMGQRFHDDDVAALVAAGMFELDGQRWRFRSDVVREVAYHTLTKVARAQRHAGVAESMRTHGRGGLLADVAHHAACAAELRRELGTVVGVSPDIVDMAIDLLIQAAGELYELGGFRRGAAIAERALGLVDPDDSRVPELLLLHATGLVEIRALEPARQQLDRLMDRLDREETTDPASRVLLGDAMRLSGTLHQIDGDLVAARADLGRSVDICRAIGATDHLADALRARGFAEVFGGSIDEADVFLSEADALYEALGDERGRAWIKQNRAWGAFLAGDAPLAEQLLLDASSVFDELGDRSGLTWGRGLLAFVVYSERRLDEARALAESVMEPARTWGDDWGAAMMMTLLANLRLWSGDFEEASRLGERALAGFRRVGDHFGVAQALAPLDRALVALGRELDAERGIEESLALADAFGDLAFPTISAAGTAMHLGQGPRTVELARKAIERSQRTGVDLDEVRVLAALGDCLSGRPEEALVALDATAAGGSPFALAARALAHAMTGDFPHALDDAEAAEAFAGVSYFDRLLAAVAAAVAATGTPEVDATRHIQHLSTLVAACDDQVFGVFAADVLEALVGVDDAPRRRLAAGWSVVRDLLVGGVG